MGLRKIRTDNDPVLRKKCRIVESFDERLWKLLDDMKETMYDANGAGLAACQVGILKRVVLVDVGDGLVELINPEIIETDGEQIGQEGCLSFPNRWGNTIRPQYVKVKAQDRFGKWCEYEGKDLKARCFCHEIDHLNGIIYFDRLVPGEKAQFIKESSGKR
ncbi:MAG: peptide deformylase [Candidatus Fimenecus sp.]